MQRRLAALICFGLLATACSTGSTDNTAFCDLLDDKMPSFQVGEKIDLDAVREIIDEAPSDLRDDFTEYLGLAEQINELDLTSQEDAAQMGRVLSTPEAVEAADNIVNFRVDECGAEPFDPTKLGG